MSWTIYSRWATNTSTRHAFYQTFFIKKDQDVLAAGVGVIHYGKLTPEIKRDRRPVLGGIVKVGQMSQRELDKKFGDKCAKDYVSSGQVQTPLFNEGQLREELTKLFGASVRDQILPLLGLAAGSVEGEIDRSALEETSTTEPSVGDDDLGIEEPAHWGSW